MTPEELKLMKDSLPAPLVQSVLVGEALQEFWQKTPIDPINDWDLNPHLWIQQVCKDIADKVAQEVPCTSEDVMLYWLTMAVYHNMYLPSIKP